MTIVLGAHFDDGIVLLADSRVTYQSPSSLQEQAHQDTIQKLLHLSKHIVIGFAGNVKECLTLISAVQGRIASNPKLGQISILASRLSSFLKIEFEKRGYHKNKYVGVEFVIAGYTQTAIKTPKVWTFRSPNFKLHEVKHSCDVIGSGEVVRKFIQSQWDKIRQIKELKSKADWFIQNLERELENHGITNIGGLFQVLMINEQAIYPIIYGNYLTDPYAKDDAYEMTINKGVWQQINKSTGQTQEISRPDRISPKLKSIRVRDYNKKTQIPSLEDKQSIAHLNYFISSGSYENQQGTINFTSVYNLVSSPKFPMEIPLLLSLGYRAPTGDHLVEFFYSNEDSSEIVKFYSRTLTSEAPILDEDGGVGFNFLADKPGPIFFEAHIDGNRLTRRSIVVTDICPDLIEEPFNPSNKKFQEIQMRYMLAMQDKYLDQELVLGKRKAFPTYFIPCAQMVGGGTTLKFEGIIHAFYPNKFPKKTRLSVFFSFRSTPGQHKLRMDLVNATTRRRETIDNTTISCSSFLKECQIGGELVVCFLEPGVYVLEQYVDDEFCIDAIILADNYLNPSFYSLTDDAIEKVKSDGGIFLVRNSEKQSEKKVKTI